MGDRTTVTITMLDHDFKKLVAQFGSEDKFKAETNCEDILDSGDETTVDLVAFECNYAEWDLLQDLLKENKMDFDKRWQAGCEYSGGYKNYRFTNGELKELEVYETEEGTINLLKILRDIKDEKELKKEIEKYYKALMPWEPKPLSLPNSIKFIKE